MLHDWIYQLDYVHHRFRKMLRKGEELAAQYGMAFYAEGPVVRILDRRRTLTVLVDAPHYHQKQTWACKHWHHQLVLRGEEAHSSFIKLIPLPCLVQSKPIKVTCRHGVLTLVFLKQQTPPDGHWFEINAI